MKTVLIIEDEPRMRENVATILEMEGYRVVTASNGREGIDAAVRETPDIVLCDISMPELDGYGVLRALRGAPSTAHLPFIFLTAKGERRDLRQGMNLGADDYLAKPATVTELLEAISARLTRSAAHASAGALAAAHSARPFNPDFSNPAPLERLGLTPREAEVVLWVAQGKTNAEIAAILEATESTIKKHLQNVFLKLDTENRSALMLRALEALSHG